MLVWIKKKIEFKCIVFLIGTCVSLILRPVWLLPPSACSLCSHDMDFLKTGMMMSHAVQGSEIYISAFIETYDTWWDQASYYFLPFIWLKTNGTNWTWHCYFCSKRRKIYNFTISYVWVLALWLLFMEKDRRGKYIILTSQDK